MFSDDFARGQMHALMSAVFALIDTHPDQAALLHRLRVDLEAAMVMALPSAVSEEQLDGVQDMSDRVLRYAGGAVAIRNSDQRACQLAG